LKRQFSYRRKALTALLAAAVLLLPGLSCQARSKPSAPTQATKDDPGCRACVSQAASLFASGKNLQAAELLRQWRARCPGNAQLHLLLSTILVRLGGHGQEAEQCAAAAVSASPSSVPAHLQYALVLLSNGNNMQAAHQFEKVTELEPSNYEAWSSLASLYKALQEDDRAGRCAARAADLEPGTRTVRLRTLKNLERSGRTKDAVAELKRLINSSDFGPEFMQELASEAMFLGAYDEAIQASSRVCESYPRSAAPLRVMALAQLLKHDYNGCLETSKKMISLDPKSGDGRSLEGLALVKLGRLDEAEKGIQSVLDVQPELALALLAMGNLKFARGEHEAAGDNLQHAVEVDPALGRYPEVCFTLAQAFDKQGEREFSLSYYKKSLANGLSGDDATSARQAVERLESAGATGGAIRSGRTLPPIPATDSPAPASD
jgi:tetratricopeptide (TPR) repeat protein